MIRCGLGDQRLVLHAPGYVHNHRPQPGRLVTRLVRDQCVHVWALDVDDLLEIARQSVTRLLTDEECR